MPARKVGGEEDVAKDGGGKGSSSSLVGEGRNVMDEGLHGGGRLHLLRESHLVEALHGGREIVGTLGERERVLKEMREEGEEKKTQVASKFPRLSGMNST